MFAAVHTDRSGRVFVSEASFAAGKGGTDPMPMAGAIALPTGARLVPLEREAEAYDRGGRIHGLGKGRLALGAILPAGYVRLLFPAYRDEPHAVALDPLPYAAVGADPRGDVVVAAVDLHGAEPDADERTGSVAAALREHPANALVRQLARCARDHECRAARAGLGHGDLPVPLGAPPAERQALPLDLRTGYAGRPTERAAFQPTAAEIVEVAAAHLARGGARVSFGRACDGEPLRRIRVLEEAIAGIRSRAPSAVLALETCGPDPEAMRRAVDAGLDEVTVRIGSARPETYELLHGPVGHRWADVRASLRAAAERSVRLVVAVLVLPGLTDRADETADLVALLDDLPGGSLELRDLGADPLRALDGLPKGRGRGVRALLDRLREADHFVLATTREAAAV